MASIRSYVIKPHGFIWPDNAETWQAFYKNVVPIKRRPCQGCGRSAIDPIHAGGVLPEADENAPIGSPEHRMAFIDRPICGELLHRCHEKPPRSCMPCMRTHGHVGHHEMLWDYRQEHPDAPIYAVPISASKGNNG